MISFPLPVSANLFRNAAANGTAANETAANETPAAKRNAAASELLGSAHVDGPSFLVYKTGLETITWENGRKAC